MFIYSFLHYYNTQQKNYANLVNRMRRSEPHRVVSRKRGNKTYYFEVRLVNGKRRERSISKNEFDLLSLENFRYNSAKKDAEECYKFLLRNRKQADSFREIIKERSWFLSKHAPDEPETGSPFMENGTLYKTQRGEIVRSKSEQTIADILFQYHIEYEYESDNAVPGYRPDFVIWDNIRGMPVIWEHLGLLNDTKYISDNLTKLKEYEKNGYILNYNLIVTFELYSGNPMIPSHYFDSNQALEIVRKWFLE